MNVFIIGIGGFLGSSLVERVLTQKLDWHITGLDPCLARIEHLLGQRALAVKKGTMETHFSWMERQIQQADVVLPLAAIANPKIYVQNPVKVFELDFEANLKIVRLCVRYKRRLVFPSTSEVYGMALDQAFDEENTSCVQGPIHKERWIYSASKQLLDRLIFAYGQREKLSYTIFRPFNWIGPYLDSLDLENGGQGRVLVQFLGQILRGRDIIISGDGSQRRCFTDIDDALDALTAILQQDRVCRGHIFNIGHPGNDTSILTFAEKLLKIVRAHPLVPESALRSRIVHETPHQVFGEGYQDIPRRVPSVEKARRLLGWIPSVSLETSLEKTVNFHLRRLFASKDRVGSGQDMQSYGAI